jgi:hypothetical protein
MSKKNRGILLIALGNPYYGQLAANLAASIKYTTHGRLPIHLVWADDALNHLTPQKMELFDEVQECPHEMYHRKDGKRVYVKAKTHIYDLSKFDETIFLDVDVIMLSRKTLEQAFDDLKDLDFTMECRSRINIGKDEFVDDYLWANAHDIKRAYGFKDGFLYGLHSEFIYFKKCEKVARYFETVKEVFAHPKVKMKHVFDGDIPDEFAFAIAMIQHRMYPHQCPYRPLYWYLTDAKTLGTSKQKMLENHYGYSVGGNATPSPVRKTYNQLASAYSLKLGVQYPFKIVQKRQVLYSRKSM